MAIFLAGPIYRILGARVKLTRTVFWKALIGSKLKNAGEARISVPFRHRRMCPPCLGDDFTEVNAKRGRNAEQCSDSWIPRVCLQTANERLAQTCF